MRTRVITPSTNPNSANRRAFHMAKPEEPSAVTETTKVMNPRVEIDTSPPFESVKEAVDRFGGSGPWIPHHLLRSAAAGNGDTEEQVIELERDMIKKEHQTLHILKELEAAKLFVEGLKTDLMPDLMFMELNQAKLNLDRTSGDLVVIQASVESLNKKMNREKFLLDGRAKMQVPKPESILSLENREEDIPVTEGLKPASFEADQFRSMTEASRYEVVKAMMTEIEKTKNSIKMAEMRLNAAKKMEEAAKAVQAIAVAEKRARVMNGQDSSGVFTRNRNGITLSFEEYRALSRKAEQVEGTCRTKFMNETHSLGVPVLEKFEEPLSEKHSERGHVSLSQMLKEQSRLILHHPKSAADGGVEKRYFVQRKKFGFIQVPIPTRQSKKKTEGLKVR